MPPSGELSMVVKRPQGPTSWRIWLAGIRPRTLVAGAAPVLVGTALGWSDPGFRPVAAVLALIGAVALQAGANLVNDAGDGQAGIDGAERVGPPRLVQHRIVSARAVWIASGITFAVASAAGLGLVYLGGWPVLAIGLASMAAAMGYTMGPFPLGRLGLGEVAALVFFGPVAVCGTVGATTGVWNHLPLLWGLPTGLIAGALMLANNLRDRQTDAAVGKRTIAVRWPRGARWLFRALIVGAVLLPAALAARHHNLVLVLASALMVPAATRAIGAVRVDLEGRALAPALGRVVDLLAVCAVALAAALVISHGA